MERLYNVPLRKEAAKAKRHERTKRAVKALRDFLARHMKSETVLLGPGINEKLWERGIKHPPHHIKVKATKDDDGKVRVELADGSEKKESKASAKKADAKAKKTPAKKASKTETPEKKDATAKKTDDKPEEKSHDASGKDASAPSEEKPDAEKAPATEQKAE